MLFSKIDSVAKPFDRSLVCSEFYSVEAEFCFGCVAEVFTHVSSLNNRDTVSRSASTHFNFFLNMIYNLEKVLDLTLAAYY